MKIYMIAAILLMSFPHSLYAGQATLSWTAPTTNTDGTPYTDPGGYKVYWGPTTGTYPNSMDVPDPLAVTTIVSNLTEGNWYFVVTAYDDKTPANESLDSNEATKTVSISPSAPGMLTVSNLTAYTIKQQVDEFRLIVVGSVPAGTTCDPTQSTNGFYAVPRSEVIWTGTVEPLVVVADCS